MWLVDKVEKIRQFLCDYMVDFRRSGHNSGVSYDLVHFSLVRTWLVVAGTVTWIIIIILYLYKSLMYTPLRHFSYYTLLTIKKTKFYLPLPMTIILYSFFIVDLA